MELFGETVTLTFAVFIVLALAMTLGFEFINGFHDTANAVATVIYTHSLPSNVAVFWSGVCNLIGVLTSSGAVAYAIVSLLPAELVLNISSSAGFSMVIALLLSAIIWNLGTWYLGLPASSSHTLIGSILGVGLANSMTKSGQTVADAMNWVQVKNIGLSLIISPVIGFSCAALLLLLAKALIKRPELYKTPETDKAPPLWIRSILILTCTGVSFAHGSNDGQKGMGLIMLLLIGLLPGAFALKMNANQNELQHIAVEAYSVSATLQKHTTAPSLDGTDEAESLSNYLKDHNKNTPVPYSSMLNLNQKIAEKLGKIKTLDALSTTERNDFRSQLFLISNCLEKLLKTNQIPDIALQRLYETYITDLGSLTKYIPAWVKVAVGLALGLGTMIGWKRVVITIGEKIGKTHLSYAQGASAELVTMTTIGAANYFGLPVSTTHVLSSGVAGTMLANRSGLQPKTLRNLFLAWVLTLPVCIFLGASLFSSILFVFTNKLVN